MVVSWVCLLVSFVPIVTSTKLAINLDQLIDSLSRPVQFQDKLLDEIFISFTYLVIVLILLVFLLQTLLLLIRLVLTNRE